jgi:hypothetical protein
MLSGRQEPTEHHGLPVPQVREAKDARPSNGTAWRGREIVMCLIAVMCLIGCDTDETVEDFCPETEFTSRSNYIDSIYTGTWQWHFSVLICEMAGSHGSSYRWYDTIRPGQYLPWLNGPYPVRTIVLSEDALSIIVDGDTNAYCILSWRSFSRYSTSDLRISYRALNHEEIDYLSFNSTNIFLTNYSAPICWIYPVTHRHDLCPISPGTSHPFMMEYYTKVE